MFLSTRKVKRTHISKILFVAPRCILITSLVNLNTVPSGSKVAYMKRKNIIINILKKEQVILLTETVTVLTPSKFARARERCA